MNEIMLNLKFVGEDNPSSIDNLFIRLKKDILQKYYEETFDKLKINEKYDFCYTDSDVLLPYITNSVEMDSFIFYLEKLEKDRFIPFSYQTQINCFFSETTLNKEKYNTLLLEKKIEIQGQILGHIKENDYEILMTVKDSRFTFEFVTEHRKYEGFITFEEVDNIESFNEGLFSEDNFKVYLEKFDLKNKEGEDLYVDKEKSLRNIYNALENMWIVKNHFLCEYGKNEKNYNLILSSYLEGKNGLTKDGYNQVNQIVKMFANFYGRIG